MNCTVWSNICCILCSILFVVSPVVAQPRQAVEYDLKAVFILNFARFVELPRDTGNVYTVCYAGGEQVRTALGALRGKLVRTKPVEVRECTTAEEVRSANLVFISASERRLGRELLAAIRDKAVLTIAEHEGFRAQGGMIQLVPVQNRIGFKVNLTAVRSAGLRVHPQLLKLAQEVEE